jgi:hypothetical protein
MVNGTENRIISGLSDDLGTLLYVKSPLSKVLRATRGQWCRLQLLLKTRRIERRGDGADHHARTSKCLSLGLGLLHLPGGLLSTSAGSN